MFESDMSTSSSNPLTQERYAHLGQKHTVGVQKIVAAVNRHNHTGNVEIIPNDDTTRELVREGGLITMGAYLNIGIVADTLGNIFVAQDEETADAAAKRIDKGLLRFYRGMGKPTPVEDPVAA